MKVRQLIEELQGCDPDAEVVMAGDAEGNAYSPLAGYWCGAYRAETTWSGEVGYAPGVALPKGYGPEDVIHDGVPAVILTPTN